MVHNMRLCTGDGGTGQVQAVGAEPGREEAEVRGVLVLLPRPAGDSLSGLGPGESLQTGSTVHPW